jgi:hypothetical protein
MNTEATRPPTTEAAIDRAIEEVRRETAKLYAGRFDRKTYSRKHSRRKRRARRVTGTEV